MDEAVRWNVAIGDGQGWLDGPIKGNGDAELAMTLLPAMRRREPLNVSAASPRLVEATGTLQDIYKAWDRTLTKVPVTAGRVTEGSRADGVGVFFSGGVDSFYTFAKHRDEITHIITCRFDPADTETAWREESLVAAQQVAAETDKTLIVVTSNLWDVAARWSDWGPMYHGAGLAGIAHALRHEFGKVYIAATHTYRDLFPWGSHPLLDPLWSTETLEIVHDGCEATRVEKVRAISEWPTAMRHLQVCIAPPTERGSYNCGRCTKCLRTTVNLAVVGARGRCATLPADVDLRAVERDWPDDENQRSFALENLAAAETAGEIEIARALRRAMSPPLHARAVSSARWHARRALAR